MRDREERQELIEVQLDQRQNLQAQFDAMRKRHEEEAQKLMADMAKLAMPERERDAKPEVFSGKVKEADLGIGPRAPRGSAPRRPGRGKDVGHEPDA